MKFVRNWLLNRDLNRARALEGEGYGEPAAKAYERTLERATGEIRLKALMGLARCSLRSGQLARARKSAAEAAALAPSDADAWHLFGIINLELRDTIGADEAFHTALKHAPGRLDILHSQAEYYAIKFPQGAFAAGKRVVALMLEKPGEAERLAFPRELPLVFLRNLAAEQRFGDETAAYFDGLAALKEPSSAWIRPVALTHKGILFANTGKLDEAVAAHQAVLALDADFDAAHFNLGMALARKRDFDAARTSFAVYAKKHPTGPLATYGFGFIAETKPDVPELLRLYKFFLERMASNPPLPPTLGRLDLARGWVDHVRTVVEHAEKHQTEQHE